MTERDCKESSLLPRNVYEQIRGLPDFAHREQICEELFGQIFSLLDSEGIDIDLGESGYRAKTDARIMQKIEERKSFSPMRDVFGVKFELVNDADRARIAEIILDAFPNTPREFEDGTPSIRDYSIPEVRSQNRLRNKNISDSHSALHINGIFRFGEEEGVGIFELQILTREENILYKKTWEDYESSRRNGKSF